MTGGALLGLLLLSPALAKYGIDVPWPWLWILLPLALDAMLLAVRNRIRRS